MPSATGEERAAPPPEAEAETPVCPHCGGAGLVRRAVPLGHPDFGKAFPCRCTLSEDEAARRARLQRFSNLRFYLRLTFDNLEPAGRSLGPLAQQAYAQAVEEARRFAESPQGFFVLSGPSGSGKTHLAAAIANRCIERGTITLFMAVPDLLDHLRAAYRPEADTPYDDLFEQLRSVPLLVLDDLGSHSGTPWAEEKLYQLVNHRFAAQLPTVFTLAVPLERLDPKLRTRLSDPTLSRIYHLGSDSPADLSRLDSLSHPLLRAMTFDSFDPSLITRDAEELRMLRHAWRQAREFAKEPRYWLVLAGHPGKGKTRLAAAIANHCRQQGRQVLFVVVPDLLDHLRSSFDPRHLIPYDDIFEMVRTVPILVLDDLGSHSSTPWAEEKLFQIINYRYNNLLPTVVTTNLTVSALDPKLRARLTDPQVSTILLMGRFDFWEQGREAPSLRRPGWRP